MSYELMSDTFEHEGHQFKVAAYRDEGMGAPWDEHDGHGPVSEWTSRDKRPGELVLNETRGSRRYYDFQEAVKIAKRDGWNVKPYNWPTKGRQAHEAAMADFQYLKGWCSDEWCWIWIEVQLLDDSGDAIEMDEASATLGGIESDGDYWRDECARGLAADILHQMQDMIAA
jgi:hypothetical protein